MSFWNKALGAVANVGTFGLYGAAKKAVGNATQNNFQAGTYGMTPATWVPGTAQDGNPYTAILGGHMQAGGVDPTVAAAFNYQDPNQAAYTTAAQGAQALGQQAAGQQQGINNQQNGLAQLLSAQANGTGPSISALQMNQANDAAMRQAGGIQQSAIASGVNPALAAQLAQTAQSTAMQGNANTAAQGRVAEQLNGQQSLAGLLGTQGQQNLNQQQIANNNAQNFYGMGQQGAQYGNQSQQSLQQLLSGNSNTAQQINSGVAAGNVQAKTGLLGAGLNAAGSLTAKAA